MPTISTCPQCARMVTIPERLEATTLVRCPLCGAEYPLNEVLKLAPPELIPAKAAEAAQQSGESAQSASNAPPSREPVFPMEFCDLALQPETSHCDDGTMARESHFDTDALAAITSGRDKTPGENSGQVEPAPFCQRIKHKPKNALRVFLEIVLGGLAGLSIAYVALAWALGARFDLPRPPTALKPVLRFVLPERIWMEKGQPDK